jgi:hypothetical protein
MPFICLANGGTPVQVNMSTVNYIKDAESNPPTVFIHFNGGATIVVDGTASGIASLADGNSNG